MITTWLIKVCLLAKALDFVQWISDVSFSLYKCLGCACCWRIFHWNWHSFFIGIFPFGKLKPWFGFGVYCNISVCQMEAKLYLPMILQSLIINMGVTCLCILLFHPTGRLLIGATSPWNVLVSILDWPQLCLKSHSLWGNYEDSQCLPAQFQVYQSTTKSLRPWTHSVCLWS